MYRFIGGSCRVTLKRTINSLSKTRPSLFVAVVGTLTSQWARTCWVSHVILKLSWSVFFAQTCAYAVSFIVTEHSRFLRITNVYTSTDSKQFDVDTMLLINKCCTVLTWKGSWCQCVPRAIVAVKIQDMWAISPQWPWEISPPTDPGFCWYFWAKLRLCKFLISLD